MHYKDKKHYNMTKKFHKVKDNVGELLTYLHGSKKFNVFLSTKPSYIFNWFSSYNLHNLHPKQKFTKIYTIYTQKKNSQKFTQFSQLDYGEIILKYKMPR
jgi:hypothetical protein